LPAQATEIEQQRALFNSVYKTVERGDWSPVDGLSLPERELLARYVLWPDLRAAWLRANLKKIKPAEIDAFLNKYGTLRPARDLRYRKALSLAKKGDLAGYQKIYEEFYQDQGVSRLDCLSLQAEIEANRQKQVNQRVFDLWMIGTSQVEECDPVFEHLYDNKLIGPAEYRKRFELAIEAREFQLAKWLAKKIDKQHVDTATFWMHAQSSPDGFLARHDPAADGEVYRTQLVYAAERLTYRDPELALRLWNKVEMQYGFSEEQKLHTRRHIALWTARDNLPDGYRLLAKLPKAAQDAEVLRWRARTSLRDIKWQRLLVDIAAMTPAERSTEEWRYWQANAARKNGGIGKLSLCCKPASPSPQTAALMNSAKNAATTGFLRPTNSARTMPSTTSDSLPTRQLWKKSQRSRISGRNRSEAGCHSGQGAVSGRSREPRPCRVG
jgi:soluble lytic murein transglycosylase